MQGRIGFLCRYAFFTRAVQPEVCTSTIIERPNCGEIISFALNPYLSAPSLYITHKT